MRLRADALVFMVAVVGGWAAASLLVGASAAQQSAAQSTISVAPERALALGRQAMAQSELAPADGLLRVAWTHAPSRQQASRALRELHRTPDFDLPTDEASISETANLLGSEFSRMETAHFVILADTDRDWTLGKANLLERTFRQFFRVTDRLDYPAHPPKEKLLCIFFRDHSMYRAFAREHDKVEAPWIAGYYAGLSNRVVFYDDRTSPGFTHAFGELDRYQRDAHDIRTQAKEAERSKDKDRAQFLAARAESLESQVQQERGRLASEASYAADAKTIHEATHLLAFNCGVQSRAHHYPFWITEGLATTFETDRPKASYGPDKETPERMREFLHFYDDGTLIDLEAFVSMAAPPDDSAETADIMYAQSYGLVAYLYRYERRALSAYLLSIAIDPKGSPSPKKRLERFRAHFGDPQALERRWLKRMTR